MRKIALLTTIFLFQMMGLTGIPDTHPALSRELEPEPDSIQTHIVCLDPGHPSEVNTGRTEQNGLTELNINWIVATELVSALENSGITVVLTKSEEDEFVSNEDRADIANSNNADIFFRIHCDTGPEDARGMTFYYPDRQGTWDGHTGPPDEIIPLCREAAFTIHDSVFEKIDDLLKDRGIRTDNETAVGNLQGGALRGSILSQVPVVLVELCFLSNPEDAAIISADDTRTEIVDALAGGIAEYLSTLLDVPDLDLR